MNILRGLWVAAMLLVPVAVASSQGGSTYDDACPEIVRMALAATDEACESTGLNQACYGHILVDARPQAGVASLAFSAPGDIVSLLELQSLRLSALDLESGIWGVSLMNLLAHLPYAQPQNVTFLLFGDVELENDAETPTLLDVTVAVTGFVNVRLGPATYVGAIATLASGQTVTANGRMADSSWLRIILPDSGRVGWIRADLVTSEGDIETLNVVERWSPFYGPMQAFYLRSADDLSLCPQAARSGLLIQTPEGLAEVILLINEVNIRLRATAFVQAQPGGDMTIDVLDGWVQVDALNGQQFAPAGTRVSIPLDGILSPTAPPRLPVPYVQDSLQWLPVQNLDQVVVIPAPLSYEEIVSRIEDRLSPGASPEQVNSVPGVDDASPGVPNDATTPPPGQNITPQDNAASGSAGGGSSSETQDGATAGSDSGGSSQTQDDTSQDNSVSGSDGGSSDGQDSSAQDGSGSADGGSSDDQDTSTQGDSGSDDGGSSDSQDDSSGGHVPPGQGGTPPGLVDNPALGDDGPPGDEGTPPGQSR